MAGTSNGILIATLTAMIRTGSYVVSPNHSRNPRATLSKLKTISKALVTEFWIFIWNKQGEEAAESDEKKDLTPTSFAPILMVSGKAILLSIISATHLEYVAC
ncbi:hypothetical protein F5B20DRAFT_580783 [Whalleya microplaca]|nr:hypothetical protein F5B20DRAFT_580783 [Whalleya microplaca]